EFFWDTGLGPALQLKLKLLIVSRICSAWQTQSERECQTLLVPRWKRPPRVLLNRLSPNGDVRRPPGRRRADYEDGCQESSSCHIVVTVRATSLFQRTFLHSQPDPRSHDHGCEAERCGDHPKRQPSGRRP